MRTYLVIPVLLAGLLAVPSAAFAQAEIAGLVRDSSGAVLPGVTVTAASPVLIEGSRSVVTDGRGQYRVVDLRPGAYTVTFQLSGFNTVVRRGVELTGSAVTTVTADLTVGALEETVTVTGETPTVDIQSVTRQTVLDRQTIDALPTARRYYSLGALIPGVSNSSADIGGALGDTMSSLSIHGGRDGDQRILQNGVNTSGMAGQGNISGVVPNASGAQEITVDTSSVSAELGQGGVRINYIPRDGGNTFAGDLNASFSTAALQGSNFTQRVQDRGLSTPNTVERIWDFSPAFGGPLIRDALWFWVTGMHSGAYNRVAGMFDNRNAFNPNAWTYEADPSRPSENKGTWWDAQLRTTWQASRRNKLAFSYDQQAYCRCPFDVSATRAPEASADRRFPQQRIVTAEWTLPLTNRVLIEAVGLHRTTRWMNGHMLDTFAQQLADGSMQQMIAVQEQSTGMWYRMRNTFNNDWNNNFFFRGAVSYITGTHSLKAGFNDTAGFLEDTTWNFQPVTYRFNNGLPNQLTEYATPWKYRVEMNRDLGLFVQDRWTVSRLTVSGGLRYDTLKSGWPEQPVGPGALVPNRNLTIPAADNLDWQDITYRSGLSYDVFGNGKTALKISLNKYVAAQTLSGLGQQPDPVNTLVNSANRSWHDNGDFVPNCDLLNPAENGECGPLSNVNFGTAVPGQTYDPDLLTGWGHRNYNWEFSAGVQHELLPRLSIDVSYFRRWYGNFRVTDNVLLGPSDFDTFSLTVPQDPNLPGGGGYVVNGLYNVKQSAFGQEQLLNTLSDKYGEQSEHWNGLDVSFRARLSQGLNLQGGVSTGKRITDNCAVVANQPEMLLSAENLSAPNSNVWLPAEWCHQEEPFLTQVKLSGSYTIPKVEMLVSGTLQSLPGPLIAANYRATNAVVKPALGRVLSGGDSNMTINIVEPGTMYGERVNQLDLRVGKILSVGRMRASINLDLYNALNGDTILTQNNTYGAVWQRPTSILLARFAKISTTVTF